MYQIRRNVPIFLVIFSILFIICSCTDNPAGSESEEEQPPRFNSQMAPGDSAESFLEGDRYSTLNLEIDYMEGYKPTQQALDSLEMFLNRRLNKASINIGIPNSIPAGGQNAYADQDIRSLEEEYRDHFTEAGSDTLWAYLLFVDGEYSETNVLGIAYYNTSMGFFGQTIQDNSGGTTQPPRYKMEATVFAHEFGHIFGLVNNGTPMQQDHQDSANGNHCTQEECLMYYSVETTDYFANLFDGQIPNLQEFCRQDLEANGGD